MTFQSFISMDKATTIKANGKDSQVLMDFGVGDWDQVFRGAFFDCCKWQAENRRLVAEAKAKVAAKVALVVKEDTVYCIETICSECGGPLGVRTISEADWDTEKGEVGSDLFEHNEDEVNLPDKARAVKLQFRCCSSCRSI